MTGETLYKKDEGVLFEDKTAFAITSSARIRGEDVWVKKIEKVKNKGGYR